MPIPVVVWWIGSAIGGAMIGAAVGLFLDSIKEWASRMLDYILSGINRAIEVTSQAIVSLLKDGNKLYKMIQVYVMNRNRNVRVETRRENIDIIHVPPDLRKQLEANMKNQVELYKYDT